MLSQDGGDVFYGAGIQYAFSSNVQMRLEYERYELDDEPLYFGSTRSLSNEMLSESAIIHVETGLLLVVIVDADLMQTI